MPQRFLINLFLRPRLFLINLTLFVLFYHLKTSSNQSSADIVRRQLQDLSHKIHTTVSPVFASQKIERDLKMREAKPPLVNQQCLVYKFECELCDAGYVNYTSRHLHQRNEEHKSASSSIGQHFRVKHSSAPEDFSNNFSISKKCKSNFDGVVLGTFFTNELWSQCTIMQTHFVQKFLNSSFN